MTRRWVTYHDDGLTRVSRARFQVPWVVIAQAQLSQSHGSEYRARLAHQVRQDVWRLLRRKRGYLPVIEVEEACGGTAIRVGAPTSCGPLAPRDIDRVTQLLTDLATQARWHRFAAPTSVEGAGC